MIYRTIRHYASVELEMNAAERVVEYAELETEDLGGERPPAAWPTGGRIEVEDLEVAYAPGLPPVLRGLTFSVGGGERVGVVGRTGAGKSSLTLALFRFLEARAGAIRVDGLDIARVRLADLRARLSIIPQDPVLFSGTVRSNLDPFDNHSDAELFDSLRRVHLISEEEEGGEEEEEEEAVAGAEDANGYTDSSSSPSDTGTGRNKTKNKNKNKNTNTNAFASLSSPISEGGLNLSQGQRQLLCLARAIASRPRVMVLDEATSAVDMATDTLIQRSIRSELGSGSGRTTLLVIAHRLSTIADFDRILVMSDGRVAEFGTPRELWDLKSQPTTMTTAMAEEAEGSGSGSGSDKDGGGGHESGNGNDNGKEDSASWGMFRAMCEESGERDRLRNMIWGEDEGVEQGASS